MTPWSPRVSFPAVASATAGVLLALALSLGAPCAADGAPGLPPDVDVVAGIPPFAPSRAGPPPERPAWDRRLAEAGRRMGRSRDGGDLLLTAAYGLAAYGNEDEAREFLEAARTFEEAAAAYPAGDPFEAVAWLGAAGTWGLAQDGEALARAAARAEEAARRPAPRGLEGAEPRRWDFAAREVAERLPPMLVDADEATGRLSEAAQRLEELVDHAERLPSAWASHPDDVWDRAARLRWRAGDRERACEDMARSAERTTDPERSAERAFWILLCRHGLLGDEAQIRVFEPWPEPGFLDEIRVVLRGLPGNPHAWPFLLTLGSSALKSGRPDEAVDVYLLATLDPSVFETAKDRPARWGGLLAAFPAALHRERFEDAERILDVVERIDGVPRAEMDAHRVRLREATLHRDERLAREGRVQTEPIERREVDAEPSPALPPSLVPPSPPASSSRSEGANPEAEDEPDGPGSFGLLLAGAVALAFVLALLLRRR